MKKPSRIFKDMDDRPMSHEDMAKMIKRMESRKSDMDPFPEEESPENLVTA